MYTIRADQRRRQRQPEPPARGDDKNAEKEHGAESVVGDDRSSPKTRTVSSAIRQAASTMPTHSGGDLGRRNHDTTRWPRLGGVLVGHVTGTWRATSAVRPACPCRRPGRAESSGFATRPARRGVARPRDRPRLATSRHVGTGRHRTSSPLRAGGPAAARWSSSPAHRAESAVAVSVTTVGTTARDWGTACHPERL